MAGSILQRRIKPAAVRAGVGKIGWHTFRHSYSSLLRRVSADIKVQQELLRHSTIQSTLNVYTQAMSEGKRAANSVIVWAKDEAQFGSFVAAYGIANTVAMIDGALARATYGAPTYIPPVYRYRLYFDETGHGSIRAAKKFSNDRYLSITGLVIRQDIHDAQVTEQLTKIKRENLGQRLNYPSSTRHQKLEGQVLTL